MVSHLDSMKELSWVLQMAPLMVLMKANLRVPSLDLEWDKKLVLHLDLFMVLWTGREGWYNDNAVDCKKCDEEGQEDFGNNHGSLLLLLLTPEMDLSLVPTLVKSWDSFMGKCLAQHLELQMESHL